MNGPWYEAPGAYALFPVTSKIVPFWQLALNGLEQIVHIVVVFGGMLLDRVP